MPRLSIELSQSDHQKLKAIAALRGQSIKDYVLERTLVEAPNIDGVEEGAALDALRALLEPRIAKAEGGGSVSPRSMNEIAKDARAEFKSANG